MNTYNIYPKYLSKLVLDIEILLRTSLVNMLHCSHISYFCMSMGTLEDVKYSLNHLSLYYNKWLQLENHCE